MLSGNVVTIIYEYITEQIYAIYIINTEFILHVWTDINTPCDNSK